MVTTSVEQIKLTYGKNGYLELLSVTKPGQMPFFVVNEFFTDSKTGYWAKCCSYEDAVKKHEMALGYSAVDDREWFRICECGEYAEYEQPWL